MAMELRKTGISVVGDAPWGTHFCHFYETKQDLLDTLVPYFKAGLESKEFCLWVVSNSELITEEEAKGALAQAVPNLDQHLATGSIEILNAHDWYLEKNAFNLEKVASAWDAKLKRALAFGYDGMRVSGDTFWLGEKDWRDFCAYEKQVNDSITDRRMNLLCTYPLAKSGAAEILDVATTHQFAIARRQGEWEVIVSPELTQAKDEIKRLNKALQRVAERTPKASAILKYGVVVVSVSAALIIALWMESVLQSAPHVSLFLCAVILSAWFGGVRPGLLAIALSLLAFAYILPPNNSLSVETREVPRLIIFALSALFIGFLSVAQRNKAESLRRARDVLDETGQELKRTNAALQAENAERKRAEALLHAKEQEFRAIVENAPDQIIRYDREFRRTYVNPAVAQFYRLPAKTLIGKPLGSDIPEAGLDVKEDEIAQVKRRITDVFSTGKTYDYELCWTTPAGRTYFSIRLFPEFDLKGSVVNVLGISRDITERKEAEEALDERLRFETLVTELSAAFANLTNSEVDHEIDKWLQSLVEFLGVDRASFFQFGEDWTALYRSHSYTVPGIEPLPPPPIGMKDQFPWITDQLRQGVTVKWSCIPDDMAEEAVKEKEYAAKLGVKSGLNIPVLMGGSVICAITFTSLATYHEWPDEMVARLRLVGEIFAAAVERKRAEAALRESEERFRQMAENIREVFWLSTADLGNTLYVSPAYESVWGRSRESLYQDARSFFAAVHEDDRANVIAIIERDREQGFEVEYRVVRPDGSIRWIRDRGFPIRDEAGRPYRVAGIAEDMTERKSAEARIRATSEQLRALSASVQSAKEEEGTRIAREIHDELGGALTSLRWDLESFDKVISEWGDQPRLQTLREKIAAMLKLSETTISVVRRISSELRPSILDDLGLMEAIEWQAREFQTHTGIVCRCECSAENVDLNKEQSTAVFRILQEALTNILRHAQAMRVDIAIKVEAGEFVLTVSDNGRGITEDEKSGLQSLGLLGMRERAHLIGGEIDITGVEAQGTVVTVRVPNSTIGDRTSHV